MRTDAAPITITSASATALCLSCHGPLESHQQTVLDIYVVELWWCQSCNIWWGNGASQHDDNDRASFCRTHPVALAARVNRLSSLDDQAIRRRA
jgi:hypothetical protein